MIRRWPFPEDYPIHKARKMCLAYREEARRQHELVVALRSVLEKADRRLVAYSDPGILAAIDEVIRAVPDEDPVTALDTRFTDWGEKFHCDEPQVEYDLDDYVKSDDAGRLIGISSKTMGTHRIEGHIKGIWDQNLGSAGGGYWYKVRDVYALKERLPGKGGVWRKNAPLDNLDDSRRGDGECAGK